MDDVKFKTKAMKGLKRAPGGKRGAIKGHSRGVPKGSSKNSLELLDYLEARKQIYIPSYRWVLDNCLQEELKELKRMATEKTLVLLDFDVNEDLYDLSAPLSHASLIKRCLLNDWEFQRKEEKEKVTEDKEKETKEAKAEGEEGKETDKEKEKEKGAEEGRGEKKPNGDAYDSAAYSEGAPVAAKALPQREPRGGRGGQVKPSRQKKEANGKSSNNNNKRVEKQESHDSSVPPPGGVSRQLKSCGNVQAP